MLHIMVMGFLFMPTKKNILGTGKIAKNTGKELSHLQKEVSSLDNIVFRFKDSTINIDGKLFILFSLKKFRLLFVTKKIVKKLFFSASFIHKPRSS